MQSLMFSNNKTINCEIISRNVETILCYCVYTGMFNAYMVNIL